METKKDELERLYRRLNELDREHEKKKAIRHLLTILIFIAAKTFILYVTTPGSLDTCLVVSIFLGIAEYWICFFIYGYHFKKCIEERSLIDHINGRITEVRKEFEEEQKKGR